MEQAIQAAGPRLDHALGAKVGDQVCCVVQGQAAEGPARQIDIYINDGAVHKRTPFALRIGPRRRLRFPPRMSRLASSEMAAPCTFASWEAKLRPPASLP